MSDMEKDFAMRCYEFVRTGSQVPPSAVCVEALHTTTAPCIGSSSELTGCDAAWRPFFDVVMLPDGGVCLGWMRNHALDHCWIRAAYDYVADLWQRSPHALFSISQLHMQDYHHQVTPRRARILHVFRSSELVTATEVHDDHSLVLRADFYQTRDSPTLEDRIRNLWYTKKVTLSTVQEVMSRTAQHTTALPTGSATALLQALVVTAALYGRSAEVPVMERVRATAAQTCELVGDSYAAEPLSWAAALLGADTASSLSAERARDRSGPAEALHALLKDVLHPSAAHRCAALCDHVTRYVAPLRESLLVEDRGAANVAAWEGQPPKLSSDGAAAAAVARVAALGLSPSSTASVLSLCNSRDSAVFVAALGGDAGHTPPPPSPQPPSATQLEAPSVSLTWLPGVGLDTRGCWCVTLTHLTLLRTQLKLHQRYGKTAEVARAVKMADETLHMLSVSLTRRCFFTAAAYNAWSRTSIVTHLTAATQEPSVGVTLLRLSDSDAEDAEDDTLLRGLLFLFPRLELCSLHGGTVAGFLASLSTGTRDVRGFLERPSSALGAPPEKSVARVRVPEKFAVPLAAQLQRRSAATVCVVKSDFSVKDVFLAEELPSHLRDVVVFA